MGRHPSKLEAFLEVALLFEFFAICMNVPTSYGQQGFLSIDCGSTQESYNDDIGLNWVNDGNYNRGGKNSNLSFNMLTADNYKADNYKALADFRYFPEPRLKHCYELPTMSDISYLIRAMFYYNDSQSDVLPLPITFNVFINSTKWFTLTYNNISAVHFPRTIEGIFHSPGDVIYFCLQPVDGVPFISSLELRPLDPDGSMYNTTSKQQYLGNFVRENYGAAASSNSWATESLRYDMSIANLVLYLASLRLVTSHQQPPV